MRQDCFRSAVYSLFLAFVTACVLLTCAGCVRFGAAYHLDTTKVPPLDQYSDSFRSITRAEPTQKQIGANPNILAVTPNVLTLEFSESGRLVKCPAVGATASASILQNCQLKRTLDYIQEAKRTLPADKSLAVVTFIHGWHHNASWSSENFRNFQRSMDCLNWGADGDKFLYPNPPKARNELVCEHIQEGNIRYIGVYVGWRGESLRVPGNAFRFLQAVNFPFRRLGGERMAQSEDLYDALTAVTTAARATPHPAKTIVVGHSFGGLILSRLSARHLIGACPQIPSGTTSNAFLGTCHREIADLLVLMNPADNAVRSTDLISNWRATGLISSPSPPEKDDSTIGLPAPMIVSMFTPGDSATRYIQKAALWTTNLAADQIYSDAGRMSQEMRRKKGHPLDRVPSIHFNLRTSAPNDVRFLRNLCWLDQPRGLSSDPACDEVQHAIYDIKMRVLRDVIPELKPGAADHKDIGCLDVGSGNTLPCISGGYVPDPYRHGAWELLTSICWEPTENPTPVSGWWSWDFPLAISCEEASARGAQRKAQRRKVAALLQSELHDYLAVPNLLAESQSGNALFDLYLRRKRDTAPDATNRWRTIWNNTPFWLVNLPRETIQGHSGFWNAEVFSLISELASVAATSAQIDAGSSSTIETDTAERPPAQ